MINLGMPHVLLIRVSRKTDTRGLRTRERMQLLPGRDNVTTNRECVALEAAYARSADVNHWQYFSYHSDV